ncbi:MAG: hypothetical protein ACXIUO_12530 [Erythrobacter sp.]
MDNCLGGYIGPKDLTAMQNTICSRLSEIDREKANSKKPRSPIATHPTANGMALSAPLRREGLTAEHSDALNYALSLPMEQFVGRLEPLAKEKPDASIAYLLAEMVKSDPEGLAKKGRELTLRREWLDYLRNSAAFAEWQQANPEKTSWRSKPATRPQYFLMWRTSEALGVEAPVNCNRGEAHDWLMRYGANLRLRVVGSASQNSDEVQHD